MLTLLEALGERPLPQLRGIAERRGVTLVAGPRRQLAEQLAAALTTPESVQAAVVTLSDAARAALHRLLRAGGRLPLAAFTRTAGALRTFGVAAIESAAPSHHPASAAEELWYTGLIGRAFEHTPQGVVEFAFVPSDVLPLLPPVAADAPLALRPVPAPAHGWRAPGTLVDDACTLLIAVHQRGPRLVGQAWRRGDLAALHGDLLEPDLLPLLLRLVERLGWTEAKNRRVRLVHERVRGWLEQGRWEQARRLFEAWRDDARWPDLCHVPGLRCGDANWQNDSHRARQAILGHLAQVAAADGWWRVDDFVGALHTADPDFQRPDGDYDAGYIQDAATGAYLRGFASWMQVEGALIRHLLTGPLRALGLTQTGADEPDAAAPSSFTLTPLGRWLLGLAERPAEAEPAPPVVADDFTVTLPAGHAPLDRFRVARFAVPVAEGTPPPWRYRLERDALLAAERKGLPPQRVLDYLRQAGGQPVPERVAKALGRLASPASARARRVVLLEVDAALHARLQADASLAPLILSTLPEGRLLVRAGDWPKVEDTLRQMGVTVTITDL